MIKAMNEMPINRENRLIHLIVENHLIARDLLDRLFFAGKTSNRQWNEVDSRIFKNNLECASIIGGFKAMGLMTEILSQKSIARIINLETNGGERNTEKKD